MVWIPIGLGVVIQRSDVNDIEIVAVPWYDLSILPASILLE